MSEAKIVVSLREGVLEIEGSEAFVTKQLESFGDLIRKSLENPARHPPKKDTKENDASDTGKTPPPPNTDVDYEGVIEIHDGKVHVTADIPGNGTKEKILNAALIYTFGCLQAGMQETTSEQIRAVCNAHGCLDATNFAKYLKSDKKLLLITGTRSKATVKLTQPGKKKAIELINSIKQSA